MSLSSLAVGKPLPGRTTTTLSQPFDLAPVDGEQLPGRLADRVVAVYVSGDTVSVRSVSRGGELLGFVVCLHRRPKRSWFRRIPQPSLIMPWAETAPNLALRPDDVDGLDTALAELARHRRRRRPVVVQDRVDVICIADHVREGAIAFAAGISALRDFAPGMDETVRAARLRTLIDEIARIHDLIHTQAGRSQAERDQLIDGAEHLVDNAADALIGDTQ